MLWILGIVGGLVLLGVVAFFVLFDRRSPVEIMEAEDGADPLKRWARGCYAIVFGKHDPAFGGTGCARVLARDWNVRTASEASALLADLKAVPSGNAAWDLVRAIVAARFAVGAQFLSEVESWTYIGSLRASLLSTYGSWAAMAEAYGRGRREFYSQDDMQLQIMREDAEALWKVVAFK